MKKFKTDAYRIMAIDNDDMVLQAVDRSLRGAGFQVITAHTATEGLQLITGNGLPHLALVEYNLPCNIGGFGFCEKLHQFSDVPVIMMTTVDDAKIVAHAIEQHVEDYLIKPLRSGEMVARVRRVLRRLGKFAFDLSYLTQVDDHLIVNFAQCEVVISGQQVSLTPTENKLLYILMRSAGQPLTTNFLLRRLWPFDSHVRNEERLRVYIHRLRTKIELLPDKPTYVLSKRGKGYAFTSLV
jgi:DNA-binding response OmpR family regulator